VTTAAVREDGETSLEAAVFSFFQWVNLPYDQQAPALCREVEEDYWFPGFRGGASLAARAKEICGRCDLREYCLERAMEFEGNLCAQERHGVWGGLGPKERALLARQRRRGEA
jgi:WhiB family redox-sensing transcriptional regulator